MATRNQSINSIVDNATFVIANNLKAAFINTAQNEIRQSGVTYFTAMTAAYQNGLQNRTAFTKAHTRIAESMQRGVLASYDQRVTRRKELASYRVGQNRFSGGALRRALSSPDMVVATPQGVAMGNKATLDTEAAHWYRLNYGAGSRATSLYRDSSYNLNFGERVAVLRDSAAPDPGFRMPIGRWGDFGSGYGFYPTRKGRYRSEESSIPGRRYFDAGLKVFARELPLVYEDLLKNFAQQAVRGKGPLFRANVDVTGLF